MRHHKHRKRWPSFHKSERRKQAVKERRERKQVVAEMYGQTAARTCGSKFRYRTKQEALYFAAKRVGSGKAGYLRVYQCPYCHGWHMTSQRRDD